MKSGFVALVGRSNVGKSTLINTLVGTKIAAVSFRPQMTRHIIHGVMHSPEGQAVFVDTPGVFKDRKSALSGRLQQKIQEAISEIDVIVYVVDPTRDIGPEERAVYGMIRHLDIPKILVINKTDLPTREREYQEEYEAWGKDFHAVFLVSAIRASHIAPLKAKVMELLPEGDPMYPEEQLTNINKEFWIAEIIREKAFSVLDKEVPYSLHVEIDSVEEKTPEEAGQNTPMIIVTGRILTSDERYKKIIIGSGGAKIKEIGQLARREIEAASNAHAYLDLEVEVDTHWIERI